MSQNYFVAFNDFLDKTAKLSAKLELAIRSLFERRSGDALIVGHGDFKYRVVKDWGKPSNHERFPVKDCHEMVIDTRGRIYLLTNHTQNNVLVYDPSGDIIDSWTLGFDSAHGLTLNEEDNVEYLYIADYKSQTVVKTTLKGEVVLKLPTPLELGIYDNPKNYLPTHTAIANNGDIYVADGYGSSFVIQFDKEGNYVRHFGGRGKKLFNIQSAHGIAIDKRSGRETLLVTSREQACFKRFTLEGEYLETIPVPGAFVNRPVIHGKILYASVCWSGILYQPNTGFITILDEDNKVISNPGGNTPTYQDEKLNRLKRSGGIFRHVHDLCVDKDENIYICQWNAGNTYPIKLEKLQP